MSTPIRSKKQVFVLDCPDALALAEFYARLLGWHVRDSPEYPGWVDVLPPDGGPVALACQQVDDYRRPEWPEGTVPQQAHIDFYVDKISEAGPLAEAAGATRHEVQPSEDGLFVVFLDPAGHPFCLCQEV